MAPSLSPNSQLQIQEQSPGIFPELDAAGWHMCHYSEDHVNRRDEEYYFPCSNDHKCCGRECCSISGAVTAGFPLWLAILLSILLLLLLLGLLTLCLWCLLRNRSRKTAYTTTTATRSPPPYKQAPVMVHRQQSSPENGAVRTYRRVPSSSNILRHQSDSNLNEITHLRPYSPSINTTTTTVTVEESDYNHRRPPSRNGGHRFPPNRRRDWYDRDEEEEDNIDDYDDDDLNYGRDVLDRRSRSFVPSSRTRESYETAPRPIPVTYHDQSEFSHESRPHLTRVVTPEEQKASTIYYRPGSDRVASYNELPR